MMLTLPKQVEYALMVLGELQTVQEERLSPVRAICDKLGLPFDVVIPNSATQKTFEDTDSGRNLVACKDAEDMFEKLGI